MADDSSEQKVHRARQAGRKAEKKKDKKHQPNEKRNPKAFAIQSVNKAAKQVHRSLDLETKKQHVPLVDRTSLEPPPVVVAVVGPPKVGKTTLINNLIKSYTREKISDLKGPVTVVSGKKRRLTIIECNNDVNSMIDVAKIADLVLLLIDASFGFEMEIFEFLNIVQVHGFPKIMGVLTHLDLLKKNKSLKKIKKTLKQRFWTEVYQGAKLFYLSSISYGLYPKTEIHNLARFISVMKFRPLIWRSSHPYVLADRFEDLTDPEAIRQNHKCDRSVCLYGYMRGAHMKYNCKIHVIGCGDFTIKAIHPLPDPCPLPKKEKKRSLTEKERLIYAPMSGVGGIVYDKDAVYIDLGGSKAGQAAALGQNKDNEFNKEEENELMSSLFLSKASMDSKMEASGLNIFSKSAPVTGDSIQSDNRWTIPEEESVTDSNGRIRRRPIFDDDKDKDVDSNDDDENKSDSGMDEPSDDEDDDADHENEDDNEKGKSKEGKKSSKRMKMDMAVEGEVDYEDDSSNDDNDDDDDMQDFQKITHSEKSSADFNAWKENLKLKVSSIKTFRNNNDIRRVIYGEGVKSDKDTGLEEEKGKNENDLVAGLFQIKNRSTSGKSNKSKSLYHDMDSSRLVETELKQFDTEELIELIKDCFVTGKWSAAENAQQLLNDDDDEEIYGDFEDLETGEVTTGEDGPSGYNSDDSMSDDAAENENDDVANGTGVGEKTSAEKRADKKRKMKEMFNTDYDDEKGPNTFYDDLKNTMTEQAELNRKEFEHLEDDMRVQYEGFRAGMYVRIELERVPCEFVTNFDPSYPVIVGGLLPGEDNIGYIQTRFKKHRWYDKILKNRDPIIVSLGWRRFQTIPLFSIQDHNGRFRSLKYTPEHMHCIATMYGPVTPPGTGMLAIQSIGERMTRFRVIATGVIVDLDKSIQVVKKLKLVGTPLKIFKNTAFIKGMFNSALEVTKFEGASIRTVSGIRGQVKKAIKAPPGAFRATFEDKILLSDLVFCRTWFPLSCPKLYNPVQSLLLSKDQKQSWKGMRTVGQMRKDMNIKLEQNQDSLYKPIERHTRKFNPLHIPKKLQKDLPFKSKPKLEPKRKKKTYEQKRAVIMEPDEKKAIRLMKGIFAANREKQQKEKLKRRGQHKVFMAKMSKLEAERDTRVKEQRKKVYRLLGQEEKRKQRAAGKNRK